MTEPAPEPFPRDPDAPPPAHEAEAEPYDPASEAGKVYDAPAGGSGGAAEGDRTLAALAHLSGLVGVIPPHVIAPVAPLALWYLLKRADPLVERHAKEACNFQLNVLVWLALALVLSMTCILAVIGVPLALAALAIWLVLPVVAAVRVSGGADYRYPLIYRFLD